jgi:hypothetical protein
MIQIQKLLIKLFQNDFRIRSRKRENVYQRAIYFKLCEDFTKCSLTDIGNSVGLDHATVIHSRKIFQNLKFWKEDEYLQIYAEAKRILRQRIGTNRRYIYKTYKQKYTQLLLRHINLKQNYAEMKTELEKIS